MVLAFFSSRRKKPPVFSVCVVLFIYAMLHFGVSNVVENGIETDGVVENGNVTDLSCGEETCSA